MVTNTANRTSERITTKSTTRLCNRTRLIWDVCSFFAGIWEGTVWDIVFITVLPSMRKSIRSEVLLAVIGKSKLPCLLQWRIISLLAFHNIQLESYTSKSRKYGSWASQDTGPNLHIFDNHSRHGPSVHLSWEALRVTLQTQIFASIVLQHTLFHHIK